MNVLSQSPPVPSPTPSAGLLDSWLEGWSSAFRGAEDCFSAALAGGPAALDVPRWLKLIGTRKPPVWASPHEIIFESPIARLRDFSSSHKPGLVPTLVLPPQAGHDSCVVDYSAEQSQMQTILASGLERALSLDWVGATQETKDASVEDYLDVIDRAVEHCGGRVNLIGDCQGGWLATIYAALYPEKINTLTLAGAPIDFHAGEPVVHEVLRRLAPGGDLRFYEALVRADGGVLKGEHMSAQAVISGCSWATRHSASTGRRSSPKFCGIRPRARPRKPQLVRAPKHREDPRRPEAKPEGDRKANPQHRHSEATSTPGHCV